MAESTATALCTWSGVDGVGLGVTALILGRLLVLVVAFFTTLLTPFFVFVLVTFFMAGFFTAIFFLATFFAGAFFVDAFFVAVFFLAIGRSFGEQA